MKILLISVKSKASRGGIATWTDRFLQKSGCHDCYLHAPEYGQFVHMFGLEEDAGRCAELAYSAVPEYIGDLVLLCP